MASPPSDNGEYLVTGYPKLAHKMGILPEQAIFRQFSALNAESLLYQQAELMQLEKDLRAVQREDNEDSDPFKKRYAVDWYWLNESVSEGKGKQWELFLKIRAKLREYSASKINNDIKGSILI